jgi:hypothetical protein
VIYLGAQTRFRILEKLREILTEDREKLANMLSALHGRRIDETKAEYYIQHFLANVNLEELAVRDYTVVFALGLLMIIDIDPTGGALRIKYGVAVDLRDRRIKLRRTNEQI